MRDERRGLQSIELDWIISRISDRSRTFGRRIRCRDSRSNGSRADDYVKVSGGIERFLRMVQLACVVDGLVNRIDDYPTPIVGRPMIL
jgi:hypothetical protein